MSRPEVGEPGTGGLEEVWAQIEAWYAEHDASGSLNSGASGAAITAAETKLGVPFPADLRASLLRHDGSADGGWPRGTLLGVDGILSEEGLWRSLLDGGDFDDSADHDASGGLGQTQTGWWVLGWLPLDADGAGNGAVVDAAPGPRGQAGQILDMDHEVGPSGPNFADVGAYLRSILKDLQEGGFTPDDDTDEDED